MIKDALATPLLFAQGSVDVSKTAQVNMPPEQLPPWWGSINRKRKLTYQDQLNKNWMQKWLHHGRFPFKFVVHLLLVIACTWMVYLIGGNQATNSTSVADSWCRILLQDNCDQTDFTPKIFYVYSINDTVDIVSTAVNNFEMSPRLGIGRVITHDVSLVVESYLNCDSLYDTSQNSADLSTVQDIYNISSADLGPLNQSAKLHKFFECLQTMIVKFHVSSVHLTVDSRPIEFMWIIVISFTNEGNTGRLKGNFDTDRYPVLRDTPLQYVLQTRVILDIVLIFLSVVSQILHWVSIFKSIRIFLRIKRKVRTRSLTKGLAIAWKNLPFATKLRFFNVWFILAILGGICNIIAGMLDIFYVWEENVVSDKSTQVTIGIGTLLSWAYMTRYLEFNRRYTVLIDALITGLPDVMRFAAGAIPVYVGFALFGFAAFSQSTKRFASFGESFVTLFGIQNGDDMQGSFRSLDSEMIISRIYLFIFSLISIYTIANIFIAIMGNSYQSANAKLRKNAPANLEEEKERQIWDTIMGINSDTEDDNDTSKDKSGIADDDNDNDNDNDNNNNDNDNDDDNDDDNANDGANPVNDDAHVSFLVPNNKNSINLRGTDIHISDEDSTL